MSNTYYVAIDDGDLVYASKNYDDVDSYISEVNNTRIDYESEIDLGECVGEVTMYEVEIPENANDDDEIELDNGTVIVVSELMYFCDIS